MFAFCQTDEPAMCTLKLTAVFKLVCQAVCQHSILLFSDQQEPSDGSKQIS